MAEQLYLDKTGLKNGQCFEAARFESVSDTIGSFCPNLPGKKGFNISSKILQDILCHTWMVRTLSHGLDRFYFKGKGGIKCPRDILC